MTTAVDPAVPDVDIGEKSIYSNIITNPIELLRHIHRPNRRRGLEQPWWQSSSPAEKCRRLLLLLRCCCCLLIFTSVGQTNE